MKKIVLVPIVIMLVFVLSSCKSDNGEIAELPTGGYETNMGKYSITFKDVEGKEKMSPAEYKEILMKNNEDYKKQLISIGIKVTSYDIPSSLFYVSMNPIQSDEVKKINGVLTIRNITKSVLTGNNIYS